MRLVLVEDSRVDDSRVDDMENKIDLCNKLIKEFIDPIFTNNHIIKVYKNYNDFNELQQVYDYINDKKVKQLLTTIQHSNIRYMLDEPLKGNPDFIVNNVHSVISYVIDIRSQYFTQLEKAEKKGYVSVNDENGNHIFEEIENNENILPMPYD